MEPVRKKEKGKKQIKIVNFHWRRNQRIQTDHSCKKKQIGSKYTEKC